MDFGLDMDVNNASFKTLENIQLCSMMHAMSFGE